VKLKNPNNQKAEHLKLERKSRAKAWKRVLAVNVLTHRVILKDASHA